MPVHSSGAIEARAQGASIVHVESPRAVVIVVALAFVAIAVACVALSIAIAGLLMSEKRYDQMDREIRLQRLETDELGAAVSRANIPTHRETDKP